MLALFTQVFRGSRVAINPRHVSAVRECFDRQKVAERPLDYRDFYVAGHTTIETAVASGDEEMMSETVLGTFEEVVEKLERAAAPLWAAGATYLGNGGER